MDLIQKLEALLAEIETAAEAEAKAVLLSPAMLQLEIMGLTQLEADVTANAPNWIVKEGETFAFDEAISYLESLEPASS